MRNYPCKIDTFERHYGADSNVIASNVLRLLFDAADWGLFELLLSLKTLLSVWLLSASASLSDLSFELDTFWKMIPTVSCKVSFPLVVSTNRWKLLYASPVRSLLERKIPSEQISLRLVEANVASVSISSNAV